MMVPWLERLPQDCCSQTLSASLMAHVPSSSITMGTSEPQSYHEPSGHSSWAGRRRQQTWAPYASFPLFSVLPELQDWRLLACILLIAIVGSVSSHH